MNKLDAVIVICSTPRSKRIPRKCFRKINGKPVLSHILDRVQNSGLETILAVPNDLTEHEESLYLSLLVGRKVYYAKGSGISPLLRTYEALISHKIAGKQGRFPKYIVRITHDDIIIDSDTMVEMVKKALIEDLDYVYCSGIIGGAGVEVIKTENLIEKAKEIDYPVEHISYFVKYGKTLNFEPKMSIKRDYDLCLDYPKDIIVLEQVMRAVGNDASTGIICAYLDAYPQVLEYNKKPLLSIYTCCYNAEKYISECMVSVLMAEKMCHFPIEYIVIDDSSKDKSLYEIINSASLFDNNVNIFVNEVNIGLSSCCNMALEKAKGKYIMRLDADDMLNTIYLNQYLSKMQAEDCAIMYPNYNLVDEHGNLIQDNISGTSHHAGGALMNKRVLNEIKFTEGLMHWDSLDLFKRLSAHKELKIGYCNLTVFDYRQHDKSLSHSKENQGIRKEVLEIINGIR